MTEHEASRTLVKSPPELWAELSDQSSLANHLAEPFGEIRITRLEPETAVAWEGERASGTVRIEPSGWGTRVTLTARGAESALSEPKGQPELRPPESEARSEPPPPEPRPAPFPVPDPDPLPPAASEPPAPEAPRRGLLGRLRGWFGARLAPSPEAPPGSEPALAEPLEAVAAPAEPPEPAAAPAGPPGAGAADEASTDTVEAADAAIDPAAVLVGVLDRLGAAHRRPFSHT